MQSYLILSIAILLCIVSSQAAWAVSDQGQKILNNYKNYEQQGSAPATSQPYSPDAQPSVVNAVPAPKTNVAVPTTPTSSSPSVQSAPTAPSPPTPTGTQPLALVFMIIAIAAIAFGAYKKSKMPWGSINNPPSMKQLAWLRNRGYRGPMPSSSRDAHYIIKDMQRGGDGNYRRDDYRH